MNTPSSSERNKIGPDSDVEEEDEQETSIESNQTSKKIDLFELCYEKLLCGDLCYIESCDIPSPIKVKLLNWLLLEINSCSYKDRYRFSKDVLSWSLLEAVKAGNKDLVAKLLDYYGGIINVNKQDKDGKTPFMHALIAKDLSMIKTFVDYSDYCRRRSGYPDPRYFDYKDQEYKNVVYYAVESGNLAIVKFICSYIRSANYGLYTDHYTIECEPIEKLKKDGKITSEVASQMYELFEDAWKFYEKAQGAVARMKVHEEQHKIGEGIYLCNCEFNYM